MNNHKYIRSMLFSNISQIERMAHADLHKPDVYIVDLEDSIPLANKAKTRELVFKFLSKKQDAIMALRINPLNTTHGLYDLIALLEHDIKFDILIPSKISNAEEMAYYRNILVEHKKNYRLFPLIETALSVENVVEIAKEVPIDGGLLFGAADYAADIGSNITSDLCEYARSKIVLAAAIAKIQAIDTPCFVLDDTECDRDSKKAKSMGFTGKLAVHPSQINFINQIFSLTHHEAIKSQTIIDTFEGTGNKITRVSKQMIGPPFVNISKKLLKNMHRL